MPIVQALMDKLAKTYGPEKGKEVYYAMEASGKGPFAPGAKHRAAHEAFAAKHGVTPVGKAKAPASSKKRGPAKKSTGPASRPRRRR